VLGSEERYFAAFNWHDRLGGLHPLDVTTIEIRTVLRASTAGEYTVGASGIGRFSLVLRGDVAFDETIRLAPGLDPVEGLSRPPQHAVRVALAAGEELPIVLRHELRSGSAGTTFEGLGVTFQLSVEEPYADDDTAIAEAVALAAASDVAIVVVGTTEEVESEGYDRETLALPGRQDDLVRAVVAANPRTVVVINAGSPVVVPWAQEVPALLMTWFPGQEGGNGVADVLLGRVEPGGRLPVSWPADEAHLPSTQPVDGVLEYTEDLFIGYRAYDRDGREPAFPFGHGLGYTTWEFRGIETGEVDLGAPDGGVEVSVRVANVGARAGREVVQVYASRAAGAVERPLRWLVGFGGVEVEPGDEAVVRVRVPLRALQHWDVATHAWVFEPGTITFAAGPDSRTLPVSCTLEA
jgi:beta-glucosidase